MAGQRRGMIRQVTGTLVALTLAAATPASGQQAQRFTPASDWQLDYATEACTLTRSFALDGQNLELRIQSHGSWNLFRVTLVGQAVKRTNRSSDQIAFRFSPDREDRKVLALLGTIGDRNALSFTTHFGTPVPPVRGLSGRQWVERSAQPLPIDTTFDKATTGLTVRVGNGKVIELALGSMAAPARAMRECVDDLHKSWGLDPAVQRDLSRLPVLSIDAVYDLFQRYPPSVDARNVPGFIPLRLMVGADGAVQACILQIDGVPKALADTICTAMSGTYGPALDKAGNPVPSVYANSIAYLTP